MDALSASKEEAGQGEEKTNAARPRDYYGEGEAIILLCEMHPRPLFNRRDRFLERGPIVTAPFLR